MGFGPQLVDLDGDGSKDMISGSYWPGEIWIFRGRKEGGFAEGAPLKDHEGKNLHAGPPWKSEDNPEMDSLASAPFAHDHDGDGDLDLLVGNIAGRVILIRNDGGPGKPAFGASKEKILAGGKPIEVPGGDAGPTVADWDGDGRMDLLVGAGDGSLWWFRNKGNAAKTEYAGGVALLEAAVAADGSATADSLPVRPGKRLKPCAADYDGDGLLDLLVGDFTSRRKPAPRLTREEEERRDDLRKRRDQLREDIGKLTEKAENAKGKELEEDPELDRAQEALAGVMNDLVPLEGGPERHGWVWLYRRQPSSGGSVRPAALK